MKDNYKIEKRGQYYYLLNNKTVLYKSKDKQKVQSRYDGRRQSQSNQIDREFASRTHYIDSMRNIFRSKLW